MTPGERTWELRQMRLQVAGEIMRRRCFICGRRAMCLHREPKLLLALYRDRGGDIGQATDPKANGAQG